MAIYAAPRVKEVLFPSKTTLQETKGRLRIVWILIVSNK